MHALSRQWSIDQNRPYSAEGKLILFDKLHKIVFFESKCPRIMYHCHFQDNQGLGPKETKTSLLTSQSIDY